MEALKTARRGLLSRLTGLGSTGAGQLRRTASVKVKNLDFTL